MMELLFKVIAGILAALAISILVGLFLSALHHDDKYQEDD